MDNRDDQARMYSRVLKQDDIDIQALMHEFSRSTQLRAAGESALARQLSPNYPGRILRSNDAQPLTLRETNQVITGKKILVVSTTGKVTEADTLDEAKSIAANEAHQTSADVFILKPVIKVSPKRETVETELA